VGTWEFAQPAPSSKKIHQPENLNPKCKLAGVHASTIQGLPFPVHGYSHFTTFNITYHKRKYVSRATYDDHNGTSCFVEWRGNYTINPRLEEYPNVTLYPYTSSGIQTVTASSGHCAAYQLDPASCTYLSSSSQDLHFCFVVWDALISEAPCSLFRLWSRIPYGTYSFEPSGPTLQVLDRKHEDSEDLEEDLQSSEARTLFSFLPALFCLVLLLIA